jgi:hypothetical protein
MTTMVILCRMFILPQMPQQGMAVHARHVQVQDHHVNVVPSLRWLSTTSPSFIQRTVESTRCPDHLADDAGIGSVILDQQHLKWTHAHTPPTIDAGLRTSLALMLDVAISSR